MKVCQECGAELHPNHDDVLVDSEDDWMGEDGHWHVV